MDDSSLGYFLQQWAAANPETTEGSVSSAQIQFFWDLLQKQHRITNILEIGFNSGLSASMFLAKKGTRVVSVDLGAHTYVLNAKRWIDSRYPGRHTLVIGDSTLALGTANPMFAVYKPDLIFVDGGHQGEQPLMDLINVHHFCDKQTWVVVDDINQPDVKKAVERVVRDMKYAAVAQCKDDKAQREWVVLKPLW